MSSFIADVLMIVFYAVATVSKIFVTAKTLSERPENEDN